MNMDEVLKTFIAESRELLEQMEEALLQLESAPDDADIINAIFRAAHTIKGSAGLFGFDLIVGFTHIAVSVLDRVRNAELQFDEALTALFLETGDHLGSLITQLDEHGNLEQVDTATLEQNRLLAERLSRYMTTSTASSRLPTYNEQAIERSMVGGLSADHWHLSLRFGPDTLRNGMDPLSLLRYLNTFGQIINIVPLLDRIPPAAEMDPETCYLGFELAFVSEAD